jgi:hypothetical protein
MAMLATWKDVENAKQPTLRIRLDIGKSWENFTRCSWVGWIDSADCDWSRELWIIRELRFEHMYCQNRGDLSEGDHYTTYNENRELNLSRAEDAIYALRKVDKGLARFEQKDGSCKSAGQYFARVCRVLKIKKMAIESQRHDGVTWGELGEMADIIDNRVREHRASLIQAQAA